MRFGLAGLMMCTLAHCAHHSPESKRAEAFQCLTSMDAQLQNAFGPPMVRVGIARIVDHGAAAHVEAKRIAKVEMEKGWTLLVIFVGDRLVPPHTRTEGDQEHLETLLAPVFAAHETGTTFDHSEHCGFAIVHARFDGTRVLQTFAKSIGKSKAYPATLEAARQMYNPAGNAP